MNRRNTAIALLSLLPLGLIVHAADEKETHTPKQQTHCPVMQRYPVDKTEYIDVKGKRVYVCCKGCINQVKANPDKYIKRLEDNGVVLEKAPAPKEIKKDNA